MIRSGSVPSRTAAVVVAVQNVGLADRIDDAVRDILANPPYLDEPNIFERALQWLAERLGGAIGGPAGSLLASVIQGIVWVAVIAVLGFVAWLVVRRIGTGAFTARGRVPATTTTVGLVDRSAADWLAEARIAAAEGRRRDAVRAAYRAVVAHLVIREAVPAMAGATVGTHRAALRRSEVVAEMQARGFDRASDVFERVWYADDEASDEDVAVVLAAADDLGVGS